MRTFETFAFGHSVLVVRHFRFGQQHVHVPGHATGSGLVFTGKLTGGLIAIDEATGMTLWQFKTGSSINSTAITYTHNGRQYVTVASGLGGGLANRYAADKVPAGGSIWTFALMP